MSKTNTAPVERATATLRMPKRNDATRASVTATVSQTMTTSPDWPKATDLQAAVKVWQGDATAITANAVTVANLKAALATAVAQQRALRANWQVSTNHVLSTATVLCDGSPERVSALGLGVVNHARLGPLAAPVGLVVSAGKLSGEAVAAWTRGDAGHGFVVQHATDANNAATYSAPVAWTKTRFPLSGLPAGGSVSFRVAAIDPSSSTGQSPWTAWTAGSAR
jgi:hypothetical protein